MSSFLVVLAGIELVREALSRKFDRSCNDLKKVRIGDVFGDRFQTENRERPIIVQQSYVMTVETFMICEK